MIAECADRAPLSSLLMLPLPLRASPAPTVRQLSRPLVAAYAFLLLITLLFWALYVARQRSLIGYAYRTDFLGVYVGARSVASGHATQLYDLGMQRSQMDQAIVPYHRGNLMAFVYPAYVAVLLGPLGAFSFSHAVLVLLAANSLLTLWMAWLLATRFSDSAGDRLVLPLALFAFVPLQLTLLQNQLGLFPTLGILEAVLALRARSPARAGCWLLLGLLKPQLIALPLLALLVWRCWNALLSFFIGLAAVLALSFAVLGWWIPPYLAFLREYNRRGAGVSLFPSAMQNWRGLLYALFQSETATTFRLLLIALTVLSLAAVVMVCRRCASPCPRSTPSASTLAWEAPFAVAILLGILSSPHLYMHDWVVFVPGGVLLWRRMVHISGRLHGSTRVLLGLLLASPFLFWFSQFIAWPPQSFIQLVPWYMGWLAMAAFVSIQGARETSPASPHPEGD